jgi:hypothetical protein
MSALIPAFVPMEMYDKLRAELDDLKNENAVNCDGLPNTPHAPIAIIRGTPCPACDAIAENERLTKAVDHARIVLEIYANPQNWKSHDGYLYLASLGHPWADARTWLTAHPKEQE